MPNRSTIFTGQYPSVHGVTTNGRNLPRNTKTFVDILLESGLYHTASFGKIHLNYFGAHSGEFSNPLESQEYAQAKNYPSMNNILPYFGIEEVKLISGHGTFCGHPDYINWVKSKIKEDPNLAKPLRIKENNSDELIQTKLNISFNTTDPLGKIQVLKHKLPEELYSTTFVKENTIDFFKRFAEGQYSKRNFFVFCSFPDPHHPFSPPGKYFDMYKPEDVILPKSFYDNHENSSKFNKKHYNELIKSEGTEKNIFPIPRDVTEEEAKQVIAASYGMEKMIDDAIGEILQSLEEYGLAENTIVVYTSDQGPFLYQGLIKIPFLIKIPNSIKGQVSNSLVSSIDIPETILELGGFNIPNTMQGRSMVPILNNSTVEINDEVLVEMDDDHNNEKTRTLIAGDWRITVFRNHGELYNLKEDPEEMNNLWDKNTFKEIKNKLLLRLLRRCINTQNNSVNRDCGY
jgi:arylsulfatase A-like enzyme